MMIASIVVGRSICLASRAFGQIRLPKSPACHPAIPVASSRAPTRQTPGRSSRVWSGIALGKDRAGPSPDDTAAQIARRVRSIGAPTGNWRQRFLAVCASVAVQVKQSSRVRLKHRSLPAHSFAFDMPFRTGQSAIRFPDPVPVQTAFRFSSDSLSSIARRPDWQIPSGLERYNTGLLPDRKRTPWCRESRKPLPHSRAYSG